MFDIWQNTFYCIIKEIKKIFEIILSALRKERTVKCLEMSVSRILKYFFNINHLNSRYKPTLLDRPNSEQSKSLNRR
jgi:hypothetical protein